MSEEVKGSKRRARKKRKMTSGGRNLAILGILSVVVALASTGVSLAIYHNSGDIYLDRSRPGFLPDEDEIGEEEERTEEEYDFAKKGSLTKEGLEEYLENMDAMMKAVDSYEKPFGPEVLSDEHLGILEKVAPDGAGGNPMDETVNNIEVEPER